MRTPRCGPAAAAAVLALALAACGAPAAGPRAATPAAAPAPATAGPGSGRAVAQGYEAVPRADLSGYLAALRAIRPALAADDVSAWRQGVFVCFQLYQGARPATVDAFAATAYRPAGATPADAPAIVAAARTHLCGAPALRKQWRQHSGG